MDENDKLKLENAKLRELVKTMWDDVMAYRDTPYMRWDGNAMVDDWTWANERRQAMMELGIEVDE